MRLSWVAIVVQKGKGREVGTMVHGTVVVVP